MSNSVLLRLESQMGLLPRHVLQQQIVELEKQRDDCANMLKSYEELFNQATEAINQRAELIAAGKALVERWDSPNWKEQTHTGVFIARLRDAIAMAESKKDVDQNGKIG
jgi:hypothetical protein